MASHLVPLLASLVFSAGAAAAERLERLDLPLEPGTTWTWEADVRWYDAQRRTDDSAKVTWQSTILGRADRPGMKIALLCGDVRDLAWYAPGQRRRRHALITTDDHAWHLLDAPQIDRLLGGAEAATVLSGDTVLFRTPLTAGDRFGDPDAVRRDDIFYAWIADAIEQRAVGGIRTIGPAPRSVLAMSLRTHPDHQFVDYADGVGVLRYVYGHHGTTAEADARLVDFRRGDAPTGGDLATWRACGDDADTGALAPSRAEPAPTGLAEGARRDTACESPDRDFASFLDRFKEDPTFRESRLQLPLDWHSFDGEKTTSQSLSLDEIHRRAIMLVVDRRTAEERRGGEGALCESVPEVDGDRARFGQFSCNTDVYAYSFEFHRVDGCWRLARLEQGGS
jgi:hypothetical protein